MAKKKIKCKVCKKNIKQKKGPGRPRLTHEKCKGKKKTLKRKKKAVKKKKKAVKKKPKVKVKKKLKKKLKVKVKKKAVKRKRTRMAGLSPEQRRQADEIDRRARARMKAEEHDSAVITTTIEGELDWIEVRTMKVGSFYLDVIPGTTPGKEYAIYRWVCNTYGKPYTYEKSCSCGTEEKIRISTRTWICDCGCGATSTKSSKGTFKGKMHLRRIEKLDEIHKQMFIDIGLGRHPRQRI